MLLPMLLEILSPHGVTEEDVNGWISQGLPFQETSEGPQFDEQEVMYWLVDKGFADVDREKVVVTIDELCEKLGINFRTAKRWMATPGFPGELNYYPIEEIAQWASSLGLLDAGRKEAEPPIPLQSVYASENSPEAKPGGVTAVNRLQALREEKMALELEAQRGDLISPEEITEEVVRLSNNIRAQVDLIPSIIESRLPGEVSKELRAMIRKTAEDVIREVEDLISEMANVGPSDSPIDSETSAGIPSSLDASDEVAII